MTPLPYVWPYAVLYWSVFVWAFIPELAIVRRARRTQTPADSKSLQVILFAMSAASFAAFPLAVVRSFQFAPSTHVFLLYFGVATMIAGGLLRRHCWRMLGTSFTGDVRVRADQQVVDRGAYRVLRHPSYTAGIMLNAGIGIALGSWLSTLLLVVASVASYSYRISVEEHALLSTLGEPYARFARTRKRLIPFVY